MTAYRLWLQEPAGSPNCPPGVPNCLNTGSYDPTKSPMCGDPQQFATFSDMAAYATTKGETLMNTTSAAAAYALCSIAPPTTSGGGTTSSGGGTSPPSGGCTN